MQTNKKKPVQKKWAKSVYLVFPNQGNRGTHVNISGAAVTKSAKNKSNAIKLIEFLSGNFAVFPNEMFKIIMNCRSRRIPRFGEYS